MILEYHRPQTLPAALELLARQSPRTIPLGGGALVTHLVDEPVAVVDLQLLELDQINQEGSAWVLGATTHLEQIVQHGDMPEALKRAICLDLTLNSRNMATLAGAIVTGDGTAALLTVLMALDAHLVWQPEGKEVSLGDYLPLRFLSRTGTLITQIRFLSSAKVHFMAVGRSPKDRPMIAAAVARWPSGRTRVVVGGDAPAPVVAMDGTEAGDIEILAQNACSSLSTRFASRDYLSETAKTLIQRLLRE
jgi:CO/xanthine dehydrogenase FAD-binding subunit